jgi:hypothetical protein
MPTLLATQPRAARSLLLFTDGPGPIACPLAPLAPLPPPSASGPGGPGAAAGGLLSASLMTLTGGRLGEYVLSDTLMML